MFDLSGALQLTLADFFCALYDELKGWQAALGAVLGFLALIFAAQRHFSLNRRRDKELKNEEALSVMAALYGEILILRSEAARLAKGVAIASPNRGMMVNGGIELNQHFVDSHTLPEPLLYKTLASKLGLLSVDTMIAIIKFYSNVETARSWLPLLVDDKTRVYQHSVLTVLRPARGAVREIIPTLRHMETVLSIAEPASDPDMGRADAIIEMEEALFDDRQNRHPQEPSPDGVCDNA